MATSVIRNSILSGVVGGMLAARKSTSFTPADYAVVANVADAIAAECITQNALLTAPMADADNLQIGPLCQNSAQAVMSGTFVNDTVAADYITPASQIVAMAKQAAAKLI